jgi:hypothetical protein
LTKKIIINKRKYTKYVFHNTLNFSQNTYQNGTRRVFESRKLSMIESLLNVAATSLSMYTIRESVKNSSSILLRSLVLTIFIAENARSVVAVETGRVSTSTITRKTSW